MCEMFYFQIMLSFYNFYQDDLTSLHLVLTTKIIIFNTYFKHLFNDKFEQHQDPRITQFPS